VFAAAEADLEPELRLVGREGIEGGSCLRLAEREPRERQIEERLLAGPQLVAANPAVEAIVWGLSG